MNETTDTSKFHFSKPDYDREPLQIPEETEQRIKQRLAALYGASKAETWYPELERILRVYYAHKTSEMIAWEQNLSAEDRFTENDVILITYGDLVTNDGQKPLETMAEICSEYLKGVFNIIHILPFFPYSSDRGFSVMDFKEVDPKLGTWDDILILKKNAKLMFDGVFNHVSSQSRWFQEFLNQNPEFTDFFTVFSTREGISADHLKIIIRPRTSEVLTPFSTLNGTRLVWTTFSEDQIDLNYHNPRVLIKMIEIMLYYIIKGADLLRLDAVTYLWEELGTSCVHLDQTHLTIKLFRDILDLVAPHVALITETNVPHQDNIRYFGNGNDEAQMVYNFALPPLVLHAFQTADTTQLSRWAQSLGKISDTATYFNFLDSHDGIGVMAVKDILTREEIEMMALKIVEGGGYISYKDNGDGTSAPYELNTTWFSALNSDSSEEDEDIQIERYLASRSIALVLMGVPGVYFHGLLGSKNDAELVIEQKSTRSINRKDIDKSYFLNALEDSRTYTSKVAQRLTSLIRIRKNEPCFHPNAGQQILDLSTQLFVVKRFVRTDHTCVLCLVNVTGSQAGATLTAGELGMDSPVWQDLISQTSFSVKEGNLHLALSPYQFLWLKPVRS